MNNPLLYTDRTGELFGIDDFIIALGMAYIGGIQANFVFASENGGNPFNPGNWNWRGTTTYTEIIGGAIGGANIAGLNIPNVGSKAMNDCVPSTFAKIESKRGGTRSYDDFKKSTNYENEVGVTIDRKNYEMMIKEGFESVAKIRTKSLFDPTYMQSAATNNEVVSLHFRGHADNVRKVAIFNHDPSKNKLYFRQNRFNFNTKTIGKHQINNIFRIF